MWCLPGADGGTAAGAWYGAAELHAVQGGPGGECGRCVELSAESAAAKLLFVFGELTGVPFVVNRNTGEVRYIVPVDWERRLLGRMSGGGHGRLQEAA